MIVYGRNPVREAIRGKRRVQRVYATERASHEVLLAEVDSRIVSVEEIEERAGSPDHQGICAEVEAYTYADADSLLEPEDALVLALDEIQDPHNLGAVCRVAESAGCSGVVLPERRSAEMTPAVCKASAGAVEHLDVARVRNLAEWLGSAKERRGLGLRRRRRRSRPVPPARLSRPRGARAGLRGQGTAAARGVRLRRADPPAALGPRRLAQRLDRCRRARVRNLALSKGP